MKPGDPAIWMRSSGRSIQTGWKIQRIPGTVARICSQRIKIRVTVNDIRKVVTVAPENLVFELDEQKAGIAENRWYQAPIEIDIISSKKLD